MLRSLVVAVVLAASVSAQGGPPGDALNRCLADSTSGRDRKDLARWIFLAMAAHPEMKQFAGAGAATAADDSSRTLAALVTRLLTSSCVNETRAAIRSGQGSRALQLAFESLGALAMQELMADKSVKDSLGVFERYIDQTRLTEAMAGK